MAATTALLSAGILSAHLPGSFSQDSLFMLNEALTTKIGHFEEWYSPAYALIWKGMISGLSALNASVFVQMSSMCVLQTLLIVGGICQLLRVREGMTWVRTAVAATGIVIWPAVFVYFGEIWRDVLMAAFLLVGVCLLDLFGRTNSKKFIASAIAVLFLAALIRQNAFIAEMPLLIWAALLWNRSTDRSYWRALVSAAMLILALAGFVWGSNRLLAETNYGRGASSIMYYDLMGMSLRTNELLLPRVLTVPDYSLETVQARYQTEYNDLTGIILPTTPEQMSIVAAAWRHAVLTHPKAYLLHRWSVTLRFLGISDVPHLPYTYGIPESLYPAYIANPAYYVRFPSTTVRRLMAEWLSRVTYWAFRPWFYGALAVGILLWERRSPGTPFWLCASGGIYWLSCFVSVPSTDFRYSWWNVLAVTTALALILSERCAAKSPS